MINKYRKKPVVVEALQWTGDNTQEVKDFVGPMLSNYEASDFLVVHTLEGPMVIEKFSYVIKGIAGEFYPCRPDIFINTYEVAE